jgi:hypothetical protein
MNSVDTLQGLISETEIRSNLQSIFPDSIILKNHFKILTVSPQIANALEYETQELVERNIEILSDNKSFTNMLEQELSKGFFDNLVVSLKGKTKSLDCKISGFYMGLISDINDIAILKVKPMNDSEVLNKQLETSRNELDEFVYRTTHDLRGPLATMRGLINLMKLEHATTTESMKYLIQLLDSHSQTLDERLFNLSYLAESAHPKTVDQNLDCAVIESTLRSSLEENVAINGVDFNFISPSQIFKVSNAQLTISMLNQILLHLISLPTGSEAKLVYTVEDEGPHVRVVITADGFLSNYQVRKAVSQSEALYTNVITYSNLINFFAAMKNADRLRASLRVDYIFEMSQQISVLIPKSKF